MSSDGWALSERADVAGGRVAWDRFGDGPAVVLVHGTPSWSYLWRGVVPRLAERFSVYVLDLVGYGDSERRDDQDMSITAQGRALAELLDRWDLDAPALVGHDVGGATVLRAHLIEGRPVSRIALVDAVAVRPWNTPTTLHMREHLEAYRTMPAHIYEEVVKAHLRRAVRRPLDEETLATYLRPWQGPVGQAAYFRKIAQWTDADVGDVEQCLGSLAVPVLVLWGAEDAWLDRSVAERIRDAIPGAELRLVPEAGHFAPEDAPEAISRDLEAFIGEAASTA